MILSRLLVNKCSLNIHVTIYFYFVFKMVSLWPQRLIWHNYEWRVHVLSIFLSLRVNIELTLSWTANFSINTIVIIWTSSSIAIDVFVIGNQEVWSTFVTCKRIDLDIIHTACFITVLSLNISSLFFLFLFRNVYFINYKPWSHCDPCEWGSSLDGIIEEEEEEGEEVVDADGEQTERHSSRDE